MRAQAMVQMEPVVGMCATVGEEDEALQGAAGRLDEVIEDLDDDRKGTFVGNSRLSRCALMGYRREQGAGEAFL